MSGSKLKNPGSILLTLFLGMIVLLPGCAVSRPLEGPRSITVTREGMLRGTLDPSSGMDAGGSIMVEKITPAKVTVGKPYEYVLRVINRVDCHFTDVVISEKFPEKYELLKASPDPAKTSGRTAEWTIGELGPKETRLFTIRGIAQEMTPMSACTRVTYTPMLCLGPETTASGLKLTMEAPVLAVLCDGIPEKIKIENTGADLLESIKISQALPEGLTTAEGKNLLEVRAEKLAGNGSKVFAVKLKVQKAGSYTHKVKALASNGLSISATAVTTVVTQPALKISVSGPEKVFMTRDADFKITVENAGNADAVSTEVSAKIPAGLKFVSATNGGAVKEDRIIWTLGTLAVQKTVSLGVILKGIATGPVQLAVTAKGACCQEVSAMGKMNVQGIPAILLDAVDTEDPIQVGKMEKFRVVVTNQGTAPDSHIVLKIDFEKNFDYVSSSGPTQAKAESSKAVEFASLVSLAPGQKATWEIVAKATDEGDHRASIHVKSDSIERPVEKIESTRVY